MIHISEQLKKGKNNVKLKRKNLQSLAQKKEPMELNNYGNVHEDSNCSSYFRDRYNCQKQSF